MIEQKNIERFLKTMEEIADQIQINSKIQGGIEYLFMGRDDRGL